jgi:hypothetical protein
LSNRHLLLYDILLPLAVVLAAGRLLSDLFDSQVLRWLDSVQAFGLGAWFGRSPVRVLLWKYSWPAFSLAPGLLWLVWVKVNVQYDRALRRRRLDRPLYDFARGFFRWIDGVDAGKWQLEAARFRAAQAEDRVRALEAELARARKAYADLEADYDELAAETDLGLEAGMMARGGVQTG